jgi:serine/threonine-protein kinase
MLQQGQVLGGRYRLDEFLHDSGASSIWSATSTDSGRRVALKILSDSLPEMPEVISRFVQDGRNASKPLHPMIVRIDEVGHTGRGIPFMVMELLEGRTLRDELAESGTIPVPRATAIMRLVLQGLAAAHGKGSCHRSIKPETIFLPAPGSQGLEVRLLNFGISRPMIASPRSDVPKQILAELGYVAPEVLMSPGAMPTPAADVFGCGAVFSEMVTGRLPLAPLTPGDPNLPDKLAERKQYFQRGGAVPSPAERLPSLPAPLDAVMARALSVDPRARFARASEMLEALEQAIATEPDIRDATVASTAEPEGGSLDQTLVEAQLGLGLGEAKTVVAAPSFEVDEDGDPATVRRGLDNARTALYDPRQHGNVQDAISAAAGQARSAQVLPDPFEQPGDRGPGAGPPDRLLGDARTVVYEPDSMANVGVKRPAAPTQKLGSQGGDFAEVAGQAEGGLGGAKTVLYQPPEGRAGHRQASAAHPAAPGPGAVPGAAKVSGAVPAAPPWGSAPWGGLGGAPGLEGWVGNWKPPAAGAATGKVAGPKGKKRRTGKIAIIVIVLFLLIGAVAGAVVGVMWALSHDRDGRGRSGQAPATSGAVEPRSPASVPAPQLPVVAPAMPPSPLPPIAPAPTAPTPSLGVSGSGETTAPPPAPTP